MSKLPTESIEDLRAQAAVSQADIIQARQIVAALDKPVKYLDGKEVKTAPGKMLKLMWEAGESQP